MKVDVGPELIKHVARIARLDLSAEEEQAFQKEFKEIISFFSLLDTVDVSGDFHVHSVPVENALREDKEGTCLSSKEIFLNAKGKEGYFVSPLIKK